MGPELMERVPRAGGALRHRRSVRATSIEVDLVDASVPGLRRPTARVHARRAHHRDRRDGASCSACRARARLHGPRRVRVRDLRRVLLQGQGDRSSSAAATPRWRRRRSSRSSRRKVTRRPPPRGVPRLEDHARPRAHEPEDRVRAEHDVVEVLGDAERERRRPARRSKTRVTGREARVDDRRRVHRDRPRAEHASCSTGQLDMDETRLHRHHAGPHAHERRRACSRAATCRTTSTARPSPPPAAGCMAAIDAERWLEAKGHSHAA